MKRIYLRVACLAAAVSGHAFAGTTMPWNAGLTSIGSNITGPTALGLVTIGAAGTFAPMIFHGEIPHYVHKAGHVALVGGTLLGIPTLVSFLGVGGALI